MLVVFNHAALLALATAAGQNGAPHLVPSDAVARMGAIGVDLFFVISGFVMALSAPSFTGPHGACTFLLLRFARIAPLYYLTCLAFLVLVINPGASVERETLLNSITFVPLFDDARYSWPLHYLGWTLAFEFVFYLVVAAVVVAGIATRPFLLLAVLACLPLLSFVTDVDLALWRVLTNPILWEFALGILAYALWRRGWLARLALPLAIALGSVLLSLALALWHAPEAVAALGHGTIDGSNSSMRAICWGIPAFLGFCLVVGRASDVPRSARPGGGARTRLLKALGDASYSIYLSHLGVVMILQKVVALVALPGDLVVVGTLLLSAVVGIAVHRTIEAPMLRVCQQAVRRLMQPASRVAGPVGRRGA